jgi:DNA anti-recombination protein RmuC
MNDIKKHLDNSLKAYDKAHSQLAEGKGNLVSQAYKLVKLGIKTKATAKLPENMLLASEEEDGMEYPEAGISQDFDDEVVVTEAEKE